MYYGGFRKCSLLASSRSSLLAHHSSSSSSLPSSISYWRLLISSSNPNIRIATSVVRSTYVSIWFPLFVLLVLFQINSLESLHWAIDSLASQPKPEVSKKPQEQVYSTHGWQAYTYWRRRVSPFTLWTKDSRGNRNDSHRSADGNTKSSRSYPKSRHHKVRAVLQPDRT